MPIYEFYCDKCHMVFNFFAGSVNVDKKPFCPKCKQKKLERRMSVFSVSRKRPESEEDVQGPDLDESRIEQAMSVLSRDIENIDEKDPRQAANLMRKLTDMTGISLGRGMEEALSRMEAGEDPEQIEAEMGDILEGEDPFNFREKASAILRKRPPKVDEKLYYL